MFFPPLLLFIKTQFHNNCYVAFFMDALNGVELFDMYSTNTNAV
jgi:hypothetical protein